MVNDNNFNIDNIVFSGTIKEGMVHDLLTTIYKYKV